VIVRRFGLDGEPAETIDAAIAALKQRYAEDGRGLQLIEVAGGYQIVTRFSGAR
jgi:chromosome segregation and condensation protein ScpB